MSGIKRVSAVFKRVSGGTQMASGKWQDYVQFKAYDNRQGQGSHLRKGEKEKKMKRSGQVS